MFPGSWKEARVAPIFKSGKPDDFSNYRPTSVIPVVTRLFEILIYDQLYKYLDSNKHLYSDQHYFRHLHLVVSCLLKCTNNWYFNIDRGKYTAMISIDLTKAFDTVDDKIVLDKMHHYGIDGLEHQWGTALISTIAGSAAKSTESHPIQQKLTLGFHKDLALDVSSVCFI